MNPHRTGRRSATTHLVIAAFVGLSAAALGCGGSNNSTSTTTTTSIVARFTPDTPTPANGSITLLQGTTTGANINIRVTVTQVPSFFGAAFRIKYDSTALVFNGMDTTGSLLNDPASATQPYFQSDATTSLGEIVITATRVYPEVPLPAAATADLVVLNFTARRAILATDTAGRLDFDDPKEACDGSVAPPNCGTINVTWSGGAVTAQ
jgi:hypothetical protein